MKMSAALDVLPTGLMKPRKEMEGDHSKGGMHPLFLPNLRPFNWGFHRENYRRTTVEVWILYLTALERKLGIAKLMVLIIAKIDLYMGYAKMEPPKPAICLVGHFGSWMGVIFDADFVYGTHFSQNVMEMHHSNYQFYEFGASECGILQKLIPKSYSARQITPIYVFSSKSVHFLFNFSKTTTEPPLKCGFYI